MLAFVYFFVVGSGFLVFWVVDGELRNAVTAAVFFGISAVIGLVNLWAFWRKLQRGKELEESRIAAMNAQMRAQVNVPLPGPSISYAGPASFAGSSTTTLTANMMAQAYASLSGQYPTRRTPEVAERDEPLYGWRFYYLDESGYLQGSAGNAWLTPEMVATCRMTGDESIDSEPIPERCIDHLEHDSCPDFNGCGIWGVAQPIDNLITARCVAWGTVMEDSEGNWRASNVRIEELVINRSHDSTGRKQQQAILRHFTGGASPSPHDELAPYRSIDWERLRLDLQLRYGVPVRLIDSVTELA